MERFAEAFGEFINDWLPRSVEPERALDTLKVPQVDEFGFGERLAVNRSDSSAKKLTAAYTYVANLLDTDFTKAADSLRVKENALTRQRRDEEGNVRQRKVAETGYRYDVYVSYKQDPMLSHFTSSLLNDLRSVWRMRPNKVSVFWDAQELAVGSTLDEITKDRVARAKVLLAILTPGYARSFATVLEWRTFELREKFTAENLILPLLCDGDMSYYPEWINRRLWIDMRDSSSTYGGGRRHELIDIVAFELDKMLSRAPRYDHRWPVASPSEVEEMIVSL